MAGLEAILISNVLKSRDLRPLVRAGLTSEDFHTAEGREWWKFIRTHHDNRVTYGQVPSMEMFKRRFPSFDFNPSQDSVEAVCSELFVRNQSDEVMRAMDDAADAVSDNDLDAGVMFLQEVLEKWQHRRAEGGDLDLSHSAALLKEQYERVETSQGMLGIPWPWEPVNEETLGMQKGQLIVIYGRPKSLKTWICLYICVFAYLLGFRVLFYSREMSKEQILRRAASIIAGVDYRDLKRATLTDSQKTALFAAIDDLRESEKSVRTDGKRAKFIISNDRGPNLGATVGLIKQKCQDEDIDLAAIDALYKLADARTKNRDSDWKTQANVTQDLKDMAVDLDIPAIGVTQANRKAGGKASKVSTEEVAFTDAVGMEVDLLMRIIKGRDEQTGKPELVLCWPATRDEELNPLLIHGCPGYNFEVKRRHLTSEEVNHSMAQEASGGDDEEGSGDATEQPATQTRERGRSSGTGRRRGSSALSAGRKGASR